MTDHTRMLLCLALATAGVLAPGVARGQSADANPRELDGHVFIPSQLVPHPFTSSYVEGVAGYGYANASAPAYNLQGNQTGTRTYDVGEMEQRFDLQVLLLPFWALRAGIGAQIYTGATGESLLGVGTNFATAGSFGTTLSFPLGDRARIGGVLDFEIGPSYNLNIVTALVGSAQAREANLSNLVSTTTTSTIIPGFVGALAIHKSLGAAIALRYSHAIPSTEGFTEPDDDLLFGATLDFDLKAISPAPIGFVGAYQLSVPIGGLQNFTSNALNLGIYYTGRVNLVVGPEFSISWFTRALVPDNYLPALPITRDVDTTSYRAQLVLRYYWQP